MNRPTLSAEEADRFISLAEQIRALAPKLVAAAQGVLDEWQVDDDGFDEEFGTGGACDAVSTAMSDVICAELADANISDGGHEGDDHAYLLVESDDEQVLVDIPPSVYETGGGFQWVKKPDVRISERDLVIENIPSPGISV